MISSELFKSTLEKTSRLLSEKYNIRLIFHTDKCVTNGKTILVPALPSDITEKSLKIYQGYIDHEVGHVLFSDFDIFKTVKGKKLIHCLQALEDIRVETKMINLWPGCQYNFESIYSDLDIKPNTKDFYAILLNIVYIARFGKDSFLSLEIKKKLPIPYDLALELYPIYSGVGSLDSTQEVKEVAVKLLAAIEEKLNKEPPEKDNAPPEENKENEQENHFLEETSEKDNAPPEEEEIEEDNFLPHEAVKKEMLESSKKSKSSSRSQKPYLIFTTEGDHIQKIIFKDHKLYKALLNEGKSANNSLYHSLERNLISLKKDQWKMDQRQGKLDKKNCHKILQDSKNIFKKPTMHQKLNTVCSLWIDHSGSMYGKKARLAAITAILFGNVLDKLKIPFEIMGYTTDDSYIGTSRFSSASKENKKLYARWGNLQIFSYKNFNQSWSSTKEYCAQIQHNENAHNTYDGEIILLAARSLLSRPEKRKVLFIVNDGQPEPNVRKKIKDHEKYLKECVKQAQKLIEIVAIGIDSDTIGDYYPNSISIKNVNQLTKTMLDQLENIFKPKK